MAPAGLLLAALDDTGGSLSALRVLACLAPSAPAADDPRTGRATRVAPRPRLALASSETAHPPEVGQRPSDAQHVTQAS